MPSVTYDSSSFIITTSRAVARRIVVVAAAFDSALTDPSTWATSCAALRASGFNTIVVRVPWSLHEPTPDRFDFTGSRDIRRLCLEAATAGLHVILRIGPVRRIAELDCGTRGVASARIGSSVHAARESVLATVESTVR